MHQWLERPIRAGAVTDSCPPNDKNLYIMDNIWKESHDAVANGARFNISLEKRTMRIGKKYVILDGKFDGELGFDDAPATSDEMLAHIEDLYDVYRHSVPSERSDARRKTYFQAMKMEELSDEELIYGEPREIAMFRLEAYILFCILCGLFDWDAIMGNKWFWASENDRNLVILGKWICGTV